MKYPKLCLYLNIASIMILFIALAAVISLIKGNEDAVGLLLGIFVVAVILAIISSASGNEDNEESCLDENEFEEYNNFIDDYSPSQDVGLDPLNLYGTYDDERSDGG